MGLPPVASASVRFRRPVIGRRQATGLVLAVALLLSGRVVRQALLVGPDGAWRREIWLDDLLDADEPGPRAAPRRDSRPETGVVTMSDDEATARPAAPAAIAVEDTPPMTAGAAISPRRHPDRPGRQPVTADHPLAINTCPVDSLQFLPGVGPVLAARIDEARRAGTVFRAPADLLAIRGIGPAAVARLAPLVRFAAEPPRAARPDNPH